MTMAMLVYQRVHLRVHISSQTRGGLCLWWGQGQQNRSTRGTQSSKNKSKMGSVGFWKTQRRQMPKFNISTLVSKCRSTWSRPSWQPYAILKQWEMGATIGYHIIWANYNELYCRLVTPKGSLVGESSQNPFNSCLGIIVNCPDTTYLEDV